MKYVKTENLTPNMILANTLYDDNEHILLKANKALSKYHIQRIQQLNFDGLYIFEDNDIMQHEPIISEKTRIAALKNLKRLNIDDCIYVANNIVDEVKSSNSIILQTINLSSYDNYTYTHSINVDILSVVLGVALGLKDNELKMLSQAALLHDIGKTCVPIDILNKPGKLTDEEYDIIKEHTSHGYYMLCENPDLSSVTRNAIYSHHENEDGSGYPRGITGDKIHKFAKIIHIADVYDALTAKRVYKDAMNPADALEYLMSQAGRMFDKDYVEVFTKYVAPYPVGTYVKLSNNECGIVIKNNDDILSRPVIKLDNHQVIDLSKCLNVTIIELLTS